MMEPHARTGEPRRAGRKWQSKRNACATFLARRPLIPCLRHSIVWHTSCLMSSRLATGGISYWSKSKNPGRGCGMKEAREADDGVSRREVEKT
jgi:hypothetical protein